MQSRLSSGLEATLNTASGFVISWMVWTFVVAPFYGLPFHAGQSFAITCIFTVTSLLRSYLWRRYFNGRITNRYELD